MNKIDSFEEEKNKINLNIEKLKNIIIKCTNSIKNDTDKILKYDNDIKLSQQNMIELIDENQSWGKIINMLK